MPVAPSDSRPVIELALESLQQERHGCVTRLQSILASDGREDEVQGYLRLIENINASLVRLAGAHVVE